MHILSVPHSTFVKRVLPFVATVGVWGWVYWPKRNDSDSLIVHTILLAVLILIVFHTLRRGIWRQADIVEDRGDRLVVTRWRTTVEIPLTQVREVLRVPKFSGSEVVIILHSPGVFGPEISFSPPTSVEHPRLIMHWTRCHIELHRKERGVWPSKAIGFAPVDRPTLEVEIEDVRGSPNKTMKPTR